MSDGGGEQQKKDGASYLFVPAATYSSTMTQLIGSGDNNGSEVIKLKSN